MRLIIQAAIPPEPSRSEQMHRTADEGCRQNGSDDSFECRLTTLYADLAEHTRKERGLCVCVVSPENVKSPSDVDAFGGGHFFPVSIRLERAFCHLNEAVNQKRPSR